MVASDATTFNSGTLASPCIDVTYRNVMISITPHGKKIRRQEDVNGKRPACLVDGGQRSGMHPKVVLPIGFAGCAGNCRGGCVDKRCPCPGCRDPRFRVRSTGVWRCLRIMPPGAQAFAVALDLASQRGSRRADILAPRTVMMVTEAAEGRCSHRGSRPHHSEGDHGAPARGHVSLRERGPCAPHDATPTAMRSSTRWRPV